MMTAAANNFSDLFIPDDVVTPEAYARCSHLAIGAHQDDLEFMAFHGINSCYGDDGLWFGGVTCTDGGGSSRAGKYADFTDDQMKTVRLEEQRKAAKIGNTASSTNSGWPARPSKIPSNAAHWLITSKPFFLQTQPDVLYTHNPADKHGSHIAVCLAVLEAVRRVPPFSRPKKVYGCEVWRDLDWLCDDDKIALDVSGNTELAEKLNACFDSQIAGGKNYGAAVMGRRKANATFFNSHNIDIIDQLWFAMDLTPLVEDDTLDIKEFVKAKITRFEESVLDGLS